MKLAKILTSRASLCVLNALILIITAASLYEAGKLLFNLTNDFNQIEEILDGMGAIFVAYGVALEERDTLMKFFKLYPQYLNDKENATDQLCHFHGLCILLLGLFMEVSVELVKIPNAIFNTEGIEGLIFGIGLIFCVAAVMILIRLCYLLIRLEPLPVKE
jgi:hypothetical protein